MTMHSETGNRLAQIHWRSSALPATEDGIGSSPVALDPDEPERPHRPVTDGRHATAQHVLAYLVPVAVALLAVQGWFRVGTVIAQGDLTPALVPSKTSVSIWNYSTGQGGPSFAIVQLPTTVGVRIASAIGISPEMFQRLWISLLFAGVAAAVVYFAFGFLEDPVAAGAAGLFASFNAYRLTTGADPIPLAAVCSAAVLGGLLLRIRPGEPQLRRIGSFGLWSMTIGYLVVNPPQVVLVAAWVLVSIVLGGLLWHREYVLAVARFLARAVPLVILLNLWWLVAVALTVRDRTFAARFAAGDPSMWAWTHVRASLVNAFALNTTWAWTHSAYFPYRAALDDGLSGLFRFALPLLGIIGVFRVARIRPRIATALILVWIITVWVAKGYHPPLADANAWLYAHVPGYWLLRDPAKVLGLATIVVALLAGAAIGDAWRRRGSDAVRLVYSLCVACLVVGSLVYVRPLFTGAVIPDSRPLLPSAHVAVPDGWTDAGAYLDSLPPTGAVLVLPMSDYYQLPTTWGYYGASFTPAVTGKPVIDLASGGYFGGYGSAPVLVSAIQQRLLEDPARSDALPLMRALGVGYVLVRRDLDSTFAGRHLENYRAIERGLERTEGIRLIRSFGVLDIYAVGWTTAVRVQTARPIGFDGLAESIPTALSVLPKRAAVIARPTNAGSDPSSSASSPGDVPLSNAPGRHGFKVRARRFADLVVVHVSEVGHPDTSSASSDPSTWWMTVAGPGSPDSFRIDSHRVSLPRLTSRWSRLPDVTTSGATVVRFPPVAPPTHVDPVRAGPVGDCDRYDERTAQEVGLSSQVLVRRLILILRLAASDHSACVKVPVHPFVPGATYRVSLSYRSVEGARAHACLLESPADTCLAPVRLANDHDWHRLRTIVSPDAASTSLSLYLYADAARSHGTITEYRNISFQAFPAVEVASAARREPTSPSVAVDAVSTSQLDVHVHDADTGTMLILPEAYAAGWELTSGSRSVDGVQHVLANGYANAWLIPWGGTYEVTLRYAPEALAHRVRVLDLVLVPIVLAATVGAALFRRIAVLRRLGRRLPPAALTRRRSADSSASSS
jgi:arabinofuranan 3-O-arabinosyltransferase